MIGKEHDNGKLMQSFLYSPSSQETLASVLKDNYLKIKSISRGWDLGRKRLSPNQGSLWNLLAGQQARDMQEVDSQSS